MLNGLFVLDEGAYEKIYPPEIRQQLEQYANIAGPLQTKNTIRQQLDVLEQVDVIFSGWGCPTLDEQLMDAAPRLKAVFYGAGSVKQLVSEAFWQREILLTSSYAANAVPVAEFTLSQILFSLKCGWQFVSAVEPGFQKDQIERSFGFAVPGAFGSTVGIISLGMIGRLVCEMLAPFDIKVIAYDPFISQEDAAKLNVELCELTDVFKRADVVSLHAPWLKETEGLITGAHFAAMKRGATFINTARGAIVREDEMIEVLQHRGDLAAILDVTHPEPPLSDSPLYTLPNVVLTPHIAGSMQRECARMGSYVVEELRRFVNGEAPRYAITRDKAAIMA